MKLASTPTCTPASTRWLLFIGLGFIIALSTSCDVASGSNWVLIPIARYNSSDAATRRRAELAHEHSPDHVSHHIGSVQNTHHNSNNNNKRARPFYTNQFGGGPFGSIGEDWGNSGAGNIETHSPPVTTTTGDGAGSAQDSGSGNSSQLGISSAGTGTDSGTDSGTDHSATTGTGIGSDTPDHTSTSDLPNSTTAASTSGSGSGSGSGSASGVEEQPTGLPSESSTETPTNTEFGDGSADEQGDPVEATTSPPTATATQPPTNEPTTITDAVNEDIYDADWTHMPLAWRPFPHDPYDKTVIHGDAWILHNPIGHFSIIPPITQEQAQEHLLNVSSQSELLVQYPLPTPLPTVDVNGKTVPPIVNTTSKQLNPGCGGLRTKTSVNAMVHGCHVATNGGYFQFLNKTLPHHCFGAIVSDSRFISYNPHNKTVLKNVHFGTTSNNEFFFGYISEDLLSRMPNGTQPPDNYNSSDPQTWYFKNLVMGVGWLIKHGKSNIKNYIRDNEDMKTPEGLNPESFLSVTSARTAIGVNTRGELVLVVIPGKTLVNGINLYNFASLLRSLNVTQAINLDGGGSATAAVPGMVSFVSDDCDPPSPILACERPVTTITCIHNSRSVPPPTLTPPTVPPMPTSIPTEEPTPTLTPTPTSNHTNDTTIPPSDQQETATDRSKTGLTPTDISIETLQYWRNATYTLMGVIVLLSLCFYWYYRQQQPHAHLYEKASVEVAQLYGSDASDDDRLASDDDGMGRHARSQRTRPTSTSTSTRDEDTFDLLKHRESDMEAL